MEMCVLCEKKKKKIRNGKPHINLIAMDEPRIYTGKAPGGFKEQDYLCLTCHSKFSHSTNKNDLSWTLWRG